jgi:GH15 family glucan-1,4-alpha-glucosidase
MNYQPIENYGIVGDLNTVALVSMEGSIDFMCFPRFDSPTIFAALLDHRKGGRFQIAPASGEFKHRQRYIPDTNILLTRFLGTDGIAEISDFMAIQALGHRHNLVRRVKVVRGEITFRMVCAPKFDYGRAQHAVRPGRREVLFVPTGKKLPSLRLRGDKPWRIVNGEVVAEFKLRADQTACFILEEADGEADSPSGNPDYVSEAFKETMNFWLTWIARSQYRGYWRETVNRSALTLKLMTSAPHGSLVAAPTFGLPEVIGVHRGGAKFHALDRAAVPRGEIGCAVAGHVSRGWRRAASGADPSSFRGIPAIRAGAHRQCGQRPASTGYLRRANGLGFHL